MIVEQVAPVPKPQEALPVPDNVVGFNGIAADVVVGYNFLYNAGVRTADGVVTWESLAAAQADLVERSKTDPAIAGMLEKVAEQGPDEGKFEAQARVEALLKVSGGTVPEQPKVKTMPSIPEEATEPSTEPRRAKRIGHAILADGHAVVGLIVPGRNEVQTRGGILRTRGTPKLGNS